MTLFTLLKYYRKLSKFSITLPLLIFLIEPIVWLSLTFFWKGTQKVYTFYGSSVFIIASTWSSIEIKFMHLLISNNLVYIHFLIITNILAVKSEKVRFDTLF